MPYPDPVLRSLQHLGCHVEAGMVGKLAVVRVHLNGRTFVASAENMKVASLEALWSVRNALAEQEREA